MPFLKVDALIDDNRATGIYEKQGAFNVWQQISPDNDYVIKVVSTNWTLVEVVDAVEVTKETATGGDSVDPTSATWIKYTVEDWERPDNFQPASISPSSPGTIAESSVSPSSPGRFDYVTPTPASPNNI